MATGSRLRRSGFSLVEIVVALAIVLVLAAVAAPSLVGYLDQMAVQAAADQLATVRDALYTKGGNGFRQDVGANSGRLSQLARPITKNNPGFVDSCGDEFSTKEANNWDGPYLNFDIDPASGMASPIGIASDLLTRVPPTGAGSVRIAFPNNVQVTQAQLLDELVDGGNGNAVGIVRWILPAIDGVVTVHYFVQIDDEC